MATIAYNNAMKAAAGLHEQQRIVCLYLKWFGLQMPLQLSLCKKTLKCANLGELQRTQYFPQPQALIPFVE
jgi:hypothetical protein